MSLLSENESLFSLSEYLYHFYSVIELFLQKNET